MKNRFSNNIIFKDVKEFNIIFLILISIFLVGISGYSSYAIFSDEIISNNEIRGVVKIKKLDNSGANSPLLTSNMIPVYYDVSDGNWKKADSENKDENYKWYDYDAKMWANAVTVSSTNRSKYLTSDAGTVIKMSDINTMWVWVPRYKYTYLSTNTPTEFDIVFEEGTSSTGTIQCTDAIVASSKKSENCTDATNGSLLPGVSTYTHPAFTFGEDELTGIWVGKFEASNSPNTKMIPDVVSSRELSHFNWFLRSRYMELKDNMYGFEQSGSSLNNNTGLITGDSNNFDTHVIKNMEWGATAYLSHSKYGLCVDGVCDEIGFNDSSDYYTGRSAGGPAGSKYYSSAGTYTYNQTGVKKVFTSGDEMSLKVTNDTTYPWTNNNGVYKSATNGRSSTTTSLKFSFTVSNSNTYLVFDWGASSEGSSDYLNYLITKDGTNLSVSSNVIYGGGVSLSKTFKYVNVNRQLEPGNYEITFTYRKDSSGNGGLDAGFIRNLRVLSNPVVSEEIDWLGGNASTTGNIYGIYDMSGGAKEAVMGNEQNDKNGFNRSGATGWSSTGAPLDKYYDKYSYYGDSQYYQNGKLGDATVEMQPTGTGGGWYYDHAAFVYYDNSWFYRGGYYYENDDVGIFYFTGGTGYGDSSTSSRMVLAINP